MTKRSLFGNKQPGDMTNGANSNFRRVLCSLGRSCCNGIASPECCHGGRGQGEGRLDTAFLRAGALLGGPVPRRSVLILAFQALFSLSAKLWIFFSCSFPVSSHDSW